MGEEGGALEEACLYFETDAEDVYKRQWFC